MIAFTFTLLLMLGTATAGPSPVAMSVATHGSALDLTFTNQTKQTLRLATYVRAEHDNLDWLTVKLTSNGTTRTLRFLESRKKAARCDSG